MVKKRGNKNIKRVFSDRIIYDFDLEYIKEQLSSLKYVFGLTVFAIIFLLVVIGILILHYSGVCLH